MINLFHFIVSCDFQVYDFVWVQNCCLVPWKPHTFNLRWCFRIDLGHWNGSRVKLSCVSSLMIPKNRCCTNPDVIAQVISVIDKFISRRISVIKVGHSWPSNWENGTLKFVLSELRNDNCSSSHSVLSDSACWSNLIGFIKRSPCTYRNKFAVGSWENDFLCAIGCGKDFSCIFCAYINFISYRPK